VASSSLGWTGMLMVLGWELVDVVLLEFVCIVVRMFTGRLLG
jgi:hypothetical protein